MSDLWGPIDVNQWDHTPFLSGRVAGEDDVREGRAVFYLQEPARIGAKAMQLGLPACAIWREGQTGSPLPVVVVQAEEAEGKTYVGVRFLSGGNGLCTIDELEVLEGPDSRFNAAAE